MGSFFSETAPILVFSEIMDFFIANDIEYQATEDRWIMDFSFKDEKYAEKYPEGVYAEPEVDVEA